MHVSSTELKSVTLYTDGACMGNPGPGGYCAVLLYGDKRREISGGYRKTTNNRMEIMAVIAGLKELRYRCAVTVITDSLYVLNSITKGWAKAWRAKGWRRDNKPVPNADLWESLLALCAQHEVMFKWVKGHAGTVENERCDKVSVQVSRQSDLPEDSGYVRAISRSEPGLLDVESESEG